VIVATLVAYYTLNITLTHMLKIVLADPQPSTVPSQASITSTAAMTTTTTTSA